MTIKETFPFNALVFTTMTTLPQLADHVGHVAKAMYQEAARLSVMPTGTIHWKYTGIDGNPSTVFELEILLPIQERNVVAEGFEWKHIPSFKCLSLIHEGDWERMPEAYQKAMDYVAGHQLTMTSECREIYQHMDFEVASHNVTEIQIGLQ
ncbi:MAG: GyrI-like domain-containing protein [Runella zeae]